MLPVTTGKYDSMLYCHELGIHQTLSNFYVLALFVFDLIPARNDILCTALIEKFTKYFQIGTNLIEYHNLKFFSTYIAYNL